VTAAGRSHHLAVRAQHHRVEHLKHRLTIDKEDIYLTRNSTFLGFCK
jgi:hypothetical protein